VKAKGLRVLLGTVAACLFLVGTAAAQAPSPAPPPAGPQVGLLTGPATVATHWSKYKYPDSIPAGATYYIVVRGDTLWDLAHKYLQNPFLWPQIWDKNRYITDAHWIYPGDPLIMPQINLVAGQAGQGGVTGTAEEGAGAGGEGQGVAGAGEEGNPLVAVTEEDTLRCAHYIVGDTEDESLLVVGSEKGSTQIALAKNDILYLNKGSNEGLKAGDAYLLHHESYKVKHPRSGKTIGTKVETTGWGHVILVENSSSTIIVDQACSDIHAGDYLTPFEKPTVPMIARRVPADRLTPHTDKTHGFLVDIADDAMIGGTGHMVSLDLGSNDGLAPGNVLSVFRIEYPSVPTPRNVIGEVTVVAVRDRTCTAKVTFSNDALMVGDEVELR